VMTKIGPWNFCATSSDNTGNTKKARRLLCERYPHILNLQDACHLINLAIKSISLLPEFEEVIKQVRTILVFMSRSSYASEHFDFERSRLGIRRGLEGIGETRFGTIYWAALSVQRGLPAFQAIVENEQLGIDIAVSFPEYQLHKTHTMVHRLRIMFELELSKYLAVIGPFAKALKSLESAHVTADQIYYFWLGIIAQLEDIFTKNEYRLQKSTMESIRAITNCCFDEMIEDAPNDTYIITFFLNPGES
ncbi:hypothetical protein BV22DRAFT_1027014, partial [Leucogyrophana mollusca]